MYLVETIPLIYIPRENPQVLSYFYQKELPKGSLVLIKLKKKEVPAIVLSSEKVKEAKAFLKKSSFTLKPLSKVILEERWFPEYFFKLAKWLSEFYIAPLTLAFSSIFPAKAEKIPKYWKKNCRSSKASHFGFPIPKELETLKAIRSEIEEAQKKNQQVLILTPSKIFSEAIFSLLKNEFQETILWYNKSEKQKSCLWKNVFEGEKKIIIGSQRALFLPYTKLGKIILAEPENQNHKNREARPFIDNREVARKIAEFNRSKLILLPLEEDKTFIREADRKKISLINLKEEKWPVVLSKKIEEKIKAGGKWLIYTNRKGYSRYLICRDCLKTVNCPNCSTPLVVHKDENGKKYLLCHHCGYSQPVPERCPHCQGFLLEERGIGSQKIYDFLPKEAKKIIFDSDNLRSLKEEKEIIKEILDGKYDFVIATELILKWFFLLRNFFDNALITSAEALLSFPHFDTSERLFLQIEKLKFISKNISIQTFNPTLKFFERLKERGLFWQEELKERKDFFFPLPAIFRFQSQPLSKIAKLTIEKKSPIAAREQADLASQALKKQGLDILGPSQEFIPKRRNLYNYEIIIKLKNEEEKKIIKEIIPSKDWKIEVI